MWSSSTCFGEERSPSCRADYGCLGTRISGIGTWPAADSHTYLNKPTDTSTGLTDVGARTYDATTGRFLSVDPVLDPGDPQSVNGYAYADNNPVTKSDPSGLKLADCSSGDCGGGPVNGNTLNGGTTIGDSNPPPPGQAAFGALYTGVQAGMRKQLGTYVTAKYENPNINMSPQLQQWVHYMAGCGGDIGDCYVAFQIALGANLSALQADQMATSICTAAGLQTSCPSRFHAWEGVRPDTVGQIIQDSIVTLGIGALYKALSSGAAAVEAGAVNAVGGTHNCVACVISGDSTLAGARASATNVFPGRPIPGSMALIKEYSGASWRAAGGQAAIEKELRAAGNGARGIVYGTNGTEAHVWNAVVQRGSVNFVDFHGIGPSGGAAFNQWNTFYFVRTN